MIALIGLEENKLIELFKRGQMVGTLTEKIRERILEATEGLR